MLGKSLAHERVVARATMRQSDCATVTVTGGSDGGDGGGEQPGDGGGEQPGETAPFDPLPVVAGVGALGALFFLLR